MKIRRIVLKLPPGRTVGAAQLARQAGTAIARGLPAKPGPDRIPALTVPGGGAPGPILARRIATAVARHARGRTGG